MPVMTSWKDIANYLGKGVRTVQRWETHGLPVRRLEGAAPKSPVFAFPEEIDSWLREQHMSCEIARDDPATSLRREIRHLRQRLQQCEYELAKSYVTSRSCAPTYQVE